MTRTRPTRRSASLAGAGIDDSEIEPLANWATPPVQQGAKSSTCERGWHANISVDGWGWFFLRGGLWFLAYSESSLLWTLGAFRSFLGG